LARSAIAPLISAGVMIANISWKATKLSTVGPPSPCRPKWSKLPNSWLSDSPKVIE
jgi:hypothetical protein